MNRPEDPADAHDRWFRAEIEKGLAELEAGTVYPESVWKEISARKRAELEKLLKRQR